jgi:dTDP-4-amino-4,6-dideoxygalactose transaminase
MKVRFVNYPAQYHANEKEINNAIFRCLHGGDLILRDEVEKFEEEFASFVGTKYAIGLNSGTDALYLALWARGIGKGDEVIVPSHTFVATAQVVHQLGATVKTVDMDGVFEITQNTAAVIPVHIAGDFGADMGSLIQTFKSFVLEDACQALGALQYGKRAGSWGDAGAFSFYPAKILGGIGDGGALVTNDEGLYKQVKELRNHCKGDTANWGINSRLDNINAAVLRVRLRHLPSTLERRKEIAHHYLSSLHGVGPPRNTAGRVWQDFIIRHPERDELYSFLKDAGIETMKNEYPMPIPKLPLAAEYERTTLRIPCNEILADDEIAYVIEKINEFAE